MVTSIHTKAAITFTSIVAFLMLFYTYPFVVMGLITLAILVGGSYAIALGWDMHHIGCPAFYSPPPPPLPPVPPSYFYGRSELW
jgi:hypothetical protein